MDIFSGEERSEIWRFWEGSGTPRDGRRGKLKHDGVRIFSRISTMAPGIQLILPGDFQEGAWPVSG
ncbi:hypothetical protein LXK88_00095, partial [Klebsiella pneumoniae]|uniref:hypothetical protein n=1 Tax=Klebsiella pneumoniae TaxID=573 RepID=UPI001F225EBA